MLNVNQAALLKALGMLSHCAVKMHCMSINKSHDMAWHSNKFRPTHTCSLDLTAGECCLVTDATQPGGLYHDAIKHVHCKCLHNLHALLGYAHIRVNLLEHPVQHGHQSVILHSQSTWLTNTLTQPHTAHQNIGRHSQVETDRHTNNLDARHTMHAILMHKSTHVSSWPAAHCLATLKRRVEVVPCPCRDAMLTCRCTSCMSPQSASYAWCPSLKACLPF